MSSLKRREPSSLEQHRAAPHSDYDNYPDKGTLRESLLKEQRGLCCYCLSRIRATDMKIEHWHSRSRYFDEQLDYGNLLASCLGNEGQPERHQHCDTRKGNSDLSRNPANPLHVVESVIRFEPDGRVASEDQTFNDEINRVLNLNEPFLINNRKATLDAFKITLLKRGNLPRITLQKWLYQWTGESRAGELAPYCQVIVYWLRKRLARA